jgi:oligopeptide transport system substrate-binding protein
MFGGPPRAARRAQPAAARRFWPSAGRIHRGGTTTMRPSRKLGLLGAALAIAVVFAVACGGEKKEEAKATPATEVRTPAPAGAYTPAPRDQQVLTVNLGAEPNFLDPHKSQFSQDIGVETLLFRGLFYTDEKGTPIPAVAREVPSTTNGGISADGKTLTIKLKDDQKWSDGSALTARDFEYSLKRAFNPKLASPYASFLFNIVGAKEYYSALGDEKNPKSPSAAELTALRNAVGVRAVDDKTLEIKLREPQPTIFNILALWIAFPVKQSSVEAGGAAEDNTQWTVPGRMIGNGMFVLKERREKDVIVVEANPNYTAGEKPKLQRINLRVIDDPDVAFNAWQTGELDMAAVPPSKVPLVDGDPNLKKLNVRAPDPTTLGLEFQATVKPLDNEKVRLALGKAIDRDAFVRVVLAGVGTPTQCWLPPDVAGYVKSDCDALAYDPAAAKRLLAEAGFPNGQNFPKLSLLMTNTALNKTIAEFIQKQFKDNLNIDIDLELVDSKVRTARYSESQFQLTVGGWHEDYHDPENWLPELFETGAGNNQFKYSNAQFDSLVKQAKFEQNNEKRIALYRQAHKVLIDTAGIAPIYYRVRNTVIKSKVKNIVLNSQDFGFTGSWAVEKIEIAKE